MIVLKDTCVNPHDGLVPAAVGADLEHAQLPALEGGANDLGGDEIILI